MVLICWGSSASAHLQRTDRRARAERAAFGATMVFWEMRTIATPQDELRRAHEKLAQPVNVCVCCVYNVGPPCTGVARWYFGYYGDGWQQLSARGD